MSRKSSLTERQKTEIRVNMEMFPAQIKKLPYFADDEKVTKSIIRNQLKKIKEETENTDAETLAGQISHYMNTYGLPSRFHGRAGVTGFVEHLHNLK